MLWSGVGGSAAPVGGMNRRVRLVLAWRLLPPRIHRGLQHRAGGPLGRSHGRWGASATGGPASPPWLWPSSPGGWGPGGRTSGGYRGFGLNRPVAKFGHVTSLKATPTRILLTMGLSTIVLLLLVDWQYIYDETGFKLPLMPTFLLNTTPNSSDDDSPESKKSVSTQRKNVQPRQTNELTMLEKAVLMERQNDIESFFRQRQHVRDKLIAELDPEKQVKYKNADFLKMIDREDVIAAQKEANQRENAGPWARVWANLKAEEVVTVPTLPTANLPVDHHGEEEEEQEEEEEEEEEKSGHTSAKVGFRNRKIIEYENRIRQYSTPDKIFRYFATYKVVDDRGHGEVMMTPQDFLRSITPGIQQPENLGLDQFNNITLEELEGSSLKLDVDEESIFHHFGSGGLITFSDYIFLLTVLSTSRRHFQIAFKMFDLNGDGNVDAKEFEVVTNLMKSQSSMGARHRDHQTTGSTFKGINSGLITYFFGTNKEGILTVDKFLDFQRHLQNEILALEFKRKIGAQEGKLSERDFAELLIAYAGFSAKKRTKMIKRVRKEFHHSHHHEHEQTHLGHLGQRDPSDDDNVLYCINDIDTALTFYHIAGAPIERETMKHVAKTVANVDLSDHVIDVVFVLFDENGDGKLSNKEFVSVMKQRAMRGLEKPKDTGIGRVLSAITKCVSDTRPTILGGMRKTE
ncbi:hypothetical protein TCAL_05156 [Tigriopus californicus]|uniref:EF-hand domain-containing protein n=1 Tax=Tigriopus californicus TaxID=6832 RepID=A0A553NNS9_TIGCA|nr:hypothetical protein TCAL_05156 [Tigriopus californicus]|eukprot:TCALIF_05156-PA protein Name:"Similar to CG4495 Calcium uptake protein 1 homolog, mitochondrial (Drosophila melanogaster)" AED:0.02 eAED:0.02 QI:353/0.75/0.8/1/1/1/5/310/686